MAVSAPQSQDIERMKMELIAALLLMVVSVLMHAWIVVRDVLIDYVQPIAVRAALLGLVAMSLVAMGLWAAQALILARLA